VVGHAAGREDIHIEQGFGAISIGASGGILVHSVIVQRCSEGVLGTVMFIEMQDWEGRRCGWEGIHLCRRQL